MIGTVRMAVRADASALERIHAQAFEPGWRETDFAGWLARPEAFAMVALEAGAPAAFGLVLASGDDAELLTIATPPAVRRLGHGRSVLLALDREAVARGLVRWVLEVAADNAAGRGLYDSVGFAPIGVRKGYYLRSGAPPVDAIVMARSCGFGGGHAAQ